MIYLIKAFVNFLLPPGFILLSLVAVIWLFRREKIAVRLLVIITFIFYLISNGFISNLLIRSLEADYSPPQNIEGDVIIMLGGGATLDTPDISGLGHLTGAGANRLLTCARLYRKLDVPIILSSGQVFKDTGNESRIAARILMDLGVPENKIIIEDKSLNTSQNVKYVNSILEANNFDKPILVTSAFHMKRAVLYFVKQNINVQPYPTDYRTSSNTGFYFNKLAPSSSALNSTDVALREYLDIIALKFFSFLR